MYCRHCQLEGKHGEEMLCLALTHDMLPLKYMLMLCRTLQRMRVTKPGRIRGRGLRATSGQLPERFRE